MDKARITNAWNNEIIWQCKKINRQNKNGENVPNLEVVEVVQFILVDNQYEQKSEVLYAFYLKYQSTFQLWKRRWNYFLFSSFLSQLFWRKIDLPYQN